MQNDCTRLSKTVLWLECEHFYLKTRPKVYRCDRGIVAIVAQDLHSSKCQAKLKYEWNELVDIYI